MLPWSALESTSPLEPPPVDVAPFLGLPPADVAPAVGRSTSAPKPPPVDVAPLPGLQPIDVALPLANVAPVIRSSHEPLPVPTGPLPVGAAAPPTVEAAASAAPALIRSTALSPLTSCTNPTDYA